MNKKNLTKGIVAAALVGVIAVGSTFAYLSATTGSKTNNFNSDKNITGKTTETTFDQTTANDYTPGQAFAKNPSISINAGSVAANVALSVDYYGLDVKTTGTGTEADPDKGIKADPYVVTSGTKLSQKQFEKYAQLQYGTADTLTAGTNPNWQLIARSDSGSELYMHKDVLDASTSATDVAAPHTLFDRVKVNAGLRTVSNTEIATTTIYEVNADGSKTPVDSNVLSKVTESTKTYVDGAGNVLALDELPRFIIDVKGFATQANIAGVDSAAELIKLANAERKGADIFKPITV